MTDHLVTPDKTIEIAGQTYTLIGNLKALKDIQHLASEDIYYVIGNLQTMPFDRMAKVISIGIAAGGLKPTALPTTEAIEQAIVDDIGILETRALLLLWLSIAVSPKRDREKKSRELEEILNRP